MLYMGISRSAVFVTALLAGSAMASPVNVTSTKRSMLAKRYNTIQNCDDSQTAKAQQALVDAATMGNRAGIVTADDPAFQHYFLPGGLNIAQGVMSQIGVNNDPTNAPYNFIIDCTEIDECNGGGTTFAVTDASPGDGKVMTLCPAFFTDEEVEFFLPDDQSNQDQLDQWCEKDDDGELVMSYTDYITAGHVILHEMTHLDSLMQGANADEVGGTHASGDVGTIEGGAPDPNNLVDARRLQISELAQPGRTDNLDLNGYRIYPARNAESFAGLGTELYFEFFCDVKYIPPQTGP